MKKSFVLVLLACAVLPVRAQRPAFEAASIKRNISFGELSSNNMLPGGRVSVTNHSLFNVIRIAYRLQTFQIAGGPDWIDADRWNIVAKANGDPPPEQIWEMLKTLLADRFRLVVHREPRELPIYALVLARPDRGFGPQLRQSSTDCEAIAASARARGGTAPRAENQRPVCGTNMQYGHLMTAAASLENITRTLSIIAGRTVLDRTGLTGTFDLDLTWRPDPPAGLAAPDARPAADDGPSLFTAIQEQLGLKLEPRRGPVEVLVIDSAARPVED